MASITTWSIVALCVILTCHGAVIHKRDVAEQPKTTLISDANAAIDKAFDSFGKGLEQLSKDGIDIQSILGNISTKASELGDQFKKFGEDVQEKVKEAAKKHELTT